MRTFHTHESRKSRKGAKRPLDNRTWARVSDVVSRLVPSGHARHQLRTKRKNFPQQDTECPYITLYGVNSIKQSLYSQPFNRQPTLKMKQKIYENNAKCKMCSLSKLHLQIHLLLLSFYNSPYSWYFAPIQSQLFSWCNLPLQVYSSQPGRDECTTKKWVTNGQSTTKQNKNKLKH